MKKVTIHTLRKMKQSGERITMLTAYDASFARLLDQAQIDVLLARIKKRGREFERRFDPDYLAELSRTYNDFFHRYDETPLLVINTSDIDFVDSDADFGELIRALGSIKHGTHYYQPMGTRP